MNRPLLPLRTVLVPTDLSPRAEAAVDYAVRLAAPDGAEVVLLHVFAYPYDWYHWETKALAELRRHVEHEAEGRVAALARRKTTPAVPVRPRLVARADVAAAVLATAEEERADVVVMGTRGWASERPALGSVTAQVIRRAGFPVLAVPHRAVASEEAPPGQVVVPVDLSAASAEALRVAHALAASRSAPLVAFHVAGEGVLAAGTWGGEAVEAADAGLAEAYERNVRRFTEAALDGAADVRLRFAAGPADGILDEVAASDLLVLAPHHGGALTEAVLAHAPCPVLVLPTGREAPRARAAEPLAASGT